VRFMMKVCFDCLWVKEDNWPLPQPSQHSLHGVLFYCMMTSYTQRTDEL
jgi:hypothetical protein